MEDKDFILGALLHDIGKAIINNRDLRNLHIYDPDGDKEKIEELQKKLDINKEDFTWYAIVYHHSLKKLPNSENCPSGCSEDYKELLEIIKKADNEASELRLEEEEGGKKQNWQVKTIYPWSLLAESILKNSILYTKIYGLLDLDKEIFTKDPLSLEEYRKKWVKNYQDEFLKELKKALKLKDPDLILAILYKWLYFYPEASGYRDVNLFSLAFHLKTTAMLADLYYKSKKRGKTVYVVFIDLVGTHNTIVSYLRKKKEFDEEGGYLKKVNYLSRFIDALTALTVRKILGLADSYTTNILYLSGSSAKIVVALDKEQKKRIEDEIHELNKKLFELTLGNSFILVHFEEVKNEKLLEGIVQTAFLNKDVEKNMEKERFKKIGEFAETLSAGRDTEDIYKKIRDFEDKLRNLLEKSKIFTLKDLGLGEEEIAAIPFEFILNREEYADKQQLVFSRIEKIFIYLESGRLRRVSIDDIENIKRTRRIGFLKIDGDLIGTLFSQIFPHVLLKVFEDILKGEKKEEQSKRENILLLLILRLSELLSFMFKYEILKIVKDLNEQSRIIKDKNKYEKAILVVYNSGDELLTIGDIELLLEFYKKFLEKKEKLLLNVIKTSAAFIYTHYKSPFNFAYQKIKDLPEEIKKTKKSYNEIKRIVKEKKEKPYEEAFRSYLKMEDGILFLESKILFKERGEFNRIVETIDVLKKKVVNKELARSRIVNMELIIEKAIEELEKDRAASIIYLVYYATKEDSKGVFQELIKDIKQKFSLNNKKEAKNILYYWLSILDFVKTITRD